MELRNRFKRAVLKVFPRAGEYKRRLLGRRPAESDSNERRQLRTEVRRLAERVGELEREVQEARRLNKRLAELTDVVAQVLLPADRRDEESIRAALDDYAKGL